MESVNQDDVDAIMAGLAASVTNLPATIDAQNMDSVKMEPVFVHKDGTADTVPCRAARMDALVMVNALWRTANTDAFVLKVGLAPIVQLHLR